jgi:hypothetical protein
MKTNKRHLLVASGSLLAATILSGVAVAGNPHGSAPGQVKAKAHVHASASVSTNTAGVKPSSTTNASKNTNALAGSTRTKVYGNGKTAGQIAMQNGASSSTNLYGPGNSQPHKPVCPGAKPTFDVHALKAHGGISACSSTSTSTSTSTSVPTSTSVTAHGNGVAGAKANGKGSTKGAFTPPSSTRTGGTLGAQHSVSNRARPAHAVLGSANFTG